MHTRLHGDCRIGHASARREHYPCPQPVAVGAAHRLGAGYQHGLFFAGQDNQVRTDHRHLILVPHPPPGIQHGTP
jgi:hypothetical protein